MSIEIIHVPDLGGADSVEVIELSVSPGESVEPEQSLVVLESDKATMDIPCPKAGIVKNLLVNVGDKVSEGSAIVEIETAAADTEIEPAVANSSEGDVADNLKQEADPVAEKPVTTVDVSLAEQTVQVPDIGTDQAVEVVEISVSVGDQIAEGDALLVLETDKATMDIPSPFSGEVVKLLVGEGDKIKQSDDIAVLRVSAQIAADTTTTLDTPATDTLSEQTPAAVSVAVAGDSSDVSDTPEASAGLMPGADVYAGPAARQLARELELDLRRVTGTGPRGRILKEDLNEYLKNAVAIAESNGGSGSGIPSVPDIDFSKFGDTEVVPLTKIQKLTAANMQRSWLNVPHVTQFDDADITELESFRKSLKQEAESRDTKITPLPFLIKACAHTLKAHPEFNRSISSDGEHFIQKHYINIGMAVDTPKGLVVPVIRHAAEKGIWQIAEEVNALALKAKEGKLTAADMQGGCFTISSLGAIGGNGFTPIVNTPEVAILGVSKSQTKPVWNGEEFVPRLMLPLALSYDHRAINGADGGRFFTFLIAQLADLRRLAL
ncbi:MAG: dihydrolipoyllysine-residue acetyltransferase [Porticoccaceae bacterium]|nr:dihydrolipoyllysine-residue acetyltransferase [Pseudomonadales bacterium]MCP5173173.1 dihydrolipoyllysine-residue acetyltransferase [Pseudomonadales bacterium]